MATESKKLTKEHLKVIRLSLTDHIATLEDWIEFEQKQIDGFKPSKHQGPEWVQSWKELHQRNIQKWQKTIADIQEILNILPKG